MAERKYKVPDAEATRAYLKKHGYKKIEERAQDDTYFLVGNENADGNKEYLRVRKNHVQGTATIDYYVIIDAQSTREEQVTISDAHTAVSILEHLGHEIKCIVKKDREIHAKDDVQIVIDHVAVLGTFIEIITEHEDEEQADERVAQISEQIGLVELITDKGYPDLLLE